MKRKALLLILVMFFAITVDLVAAEYSSNFALGISSAIVSIEPGTLTQAEKEGLLLMREEEKPARDVYIKFFER